MSKIKIIVKCPYCGEDSIIENATKLDFSYLNDRYDNELILETNCSICGKYFEIDL